MPELEKNQTHVLSVRCKNKQRNSALSVAVLSALMGISQHPSSFNSTRALQTQHKRVPIDCQVGESCGQVSDAWLERTIRAYFSCLRSTHRLPTISPMPFEGSSTPLAVHAGFKQVPIPPDFQHTPSYVNRTHFLTNPQHYLGWYPSLRCYG